VQRRGEVLQLEKKNFSSPDEVRQMSGKGQVEILKVGGGVVGKATFEPGWRWSEHVKPMAGTDSCQSRHLGYVVSGHQKVIMDDGTELDFGPGDVVAIPPGHDGVVVGDEPCVLIDFSGMEHYAEG
jgi:quercetin dioxygenase-like cupin family protein